MPLFFIISGLLSRKSGGGKAVFSNNFRKLLIPYFCLNILCLLIFITYRYSIGTFHVEQLISHINAILLGIGYETDNLEPVCTPMWFFYSLFIIKIVYSFMPKSGISIVLQLITCFLLVKMLTYYHIDTYIQIDSAIMAYPFFLIGTMGKKKFLNFKMRPDYKNLSACFLVLLLVYYVSMFNGRCDIDTMKYGASYLLFMFTGTAASFAIMNIFKNINITCRRDIVKRISDGSSLIVGLNLLFIGVLKQTVSYILGFWNDTVGILLAILILVLFLPIISVTKKYLPFVIGYR